MLPVFVINLPQELERRRHMEAELARVGLTAEFVPGVDGSRLREEDWRRYDKETSLQVYGVDMLAGEIGCYLSHYRLLQRMLDENLDVALILEDDVRFEDDFPDVLAALMQAPRDWLLVRLSTSRRTSADWAANRGRAVAQLTPRYRLLRLGTHVLGAGAYLVTRAGAQRLVDYGCKIVMPIDHTMDRYWENGIKPYVVSPFPVQQRQDLPSSIGNRDPRRRYRMPKGVLWRRRWTRLQDSMRKRLFNILNP